MYFSFCKNARFVFPIIKYFTESATQSSNGRNQYMRESMCIIKKPNGEVKTFIVGDSILTNDNLREMTGLD